MFWSDSTSVGHFTGDNLWPLYMFIANQSKYDRCKPSSNHCHHIAYFDKPSDNFKDYCARRSGGKLPPPPFTGFCNQESFHAQWEVLLDDDLLAAIKTGIVITCPDGKDLLIATVRNQGDCPCPRCATPMVHLNKMASPVDYRSRVAKTRVDNDSRRQLIMKARNMIIPGNRKKGVALSNDHFQDLIKPQSYHATLNAFSYRLKGYAGFDVFKCLAVDLLHEFELGVWKDLFIHLLRILTAHSKAAQVYINELDKRYRLVPPFQKSIRRFTWDVSARKKKAGRDFEDLLQCAIPTFEGIVPNDDHSKAVTRIISICAEWHALAKLRMHTDYTLKLLEKATIELGAEFRIFVRDVCSKIKTVELDDEVEKRERDAKRKEEASLKAASSEVTAPVAGPSLLDNQATSENAPTDRLGPSGSSSTTPITSSTTTVDPQPTSSSASDAASPQPPSPPPPPPPPPAPELAPKAKRSSAKRVELNIGTTKFHFLPDYVPMIRLFGTTDLYSTELGELMHRWSKRWYKRSSKKNPRKEVVRHERRVSRMRELRKKMERRRKHEQLLETEGTTEKKTNRYHMSASHYTAVPLSSLHLRNLSNDGLVQDSPFQTFLSQLRQDLLPRLHDTVKKQWDITVPDYVDATSAVECPSPLDASAVCIKDNRIFSHQTIRFQYTSYNVRPKEDLVNIGTNSCDVMFPNPRFLDDPLAHPYLYAHVLGIYHGHVSYGTSGVRTHCSDRFDFLWVRWYQFNASESSERFIYVSFPPVDSAGATSFVDPNTVIRAVHIIPRFRLGRVYPDRGGLSDLGHDGKDWRQYYVNRHVDRDMFMRYHIGGAVGHVGIWPSSVIRRTLQRTLDAFHSTSALTSGAAATSPSTQPPSMEGLETARDSRCDGTVNMEVDETGGEFPEDSEILVVGLGDGTCSDLDDDDGEVSDTGDQGNLDDMEVDDSEVDGEDDYAM
ncbi:hypothetical protein DFP72DRAFT_1014005 [Ephemerocybe angulata]|uniref:Uncharacterized protein n=1 Tax=Ephemerocybe angulata TaxID=980116 RepID=A0A8H6HQ61_9AGAR|nr:hypothetical protein DFP72DRAFT_1014005 [Tulosesus angulatus]